MAQPEQMVAVRWAFRQRHYRLTGHALIEALIEQLSEEDLTAIGSDSDVLEEYPNRPHGHSKLLLGYARGEPFHLVVNVENFEEDWAEPMTVVTVYRPEPPAWRDEQTRGTRR